jgi:DNA-binding CsgD family transcriptional regulator
MERQETDLLELLKVGDVPAFASDQDHRIVFWNRGAERLLGRPAGQALGRRCHDVLAGRDVFGNRFCYAACPISETLRHREAAQPVDLHVACASGSRIVHVTTHQVPDKTNRSRASFTLVHVLQPIVESGRLARILARMERGEDMPRPTDLPIRPGQAPATTGAESLTIREREVLGCVAAGFQNKEIAQALGISVATARNHVHRILEKLGVHSKLEALSLCLRNGDAESLPRLRVVGPSRRPA